MTQAKASKYVRTLEVCAVVALVLLQSGCGEEAWFVDRAEQRGIDFRHESGFDGTPMLPDIVGGGVALADLDGDGDLDAYFVQSGWLPGRESAHPLPANRLYWNDRKGRFSPANEIGDAADTGYGMGVAAGDYDDDGDVDLYVTNVGPNALLRNDGGGTFTNVAEAAGVADPSWGTASAFVDFDGDSDLDLFVVNYINWSPAVERDCFHRGSPTYCAPTTYGAPAPDRLFRNNGDGTFTDVSVAAGLPVHYGNGLGILPADFNNDGRLDVFVANDRNVDQLWINQGDLRFVDRAADWGAAVDEHGVAKAGMGVASGDVDDDGDPDLLVVNFEGETDSFFLNQGGWFSDATAAAGLGAASGRHTRFGVALADFDNDGALDLYHANGKVDGDPARKPDAFAEPNALWRGVSGGRYALVPTRLGGVEAPLVHTSRAAAVGDLDDDGRLDLVVVNRDGPAYLLMNRARAGNWVRFRVLAASGRDAHGARVSLTVGASRRQRDVQPHASYLASNDPRVHFGLGDETSVSDVVVRFPDGATQSFGDYAAGRTWELRRR